MEKAPWSAENEEDRKQASNPLPQARVQERGAKRARESFDLDRRQRRNPDPKLCRNCRALNLIGKENLSADNTIQWQLYGTWYQLPCRLHCAICKLIIEVIAYRMVTLHPRLAAIDPEVQEPQLPSREYVHCGGIRSEEGWCH